MAFANLFSKLSAVDEDVKSAGQSDFTQRNETQGSGRGNARKRKTQGEQFGSYKKRPCYQVQRTTIPNNVKDDNTKTKGHHLQSTDGESGLNGSSNRGRKTQKQQQQEKKMDGQKDQCQHTDRGRCGNGRGRLVSKRGGGGGKHKGGRQDIQMKPRFMTQEFKDQNALLVDGRLLCRHFLWGRCIKADECQLEHIQGYNDLIKEVCKFYVQGFCSKGESCPYMHKSFPCKFFHRKGKCSQGEDCRFSHEPLTDVTEKLLDEALKRESDLYELAKKAEQESSGQPANAEEPEMIEANGTPNVLIEPLRPNFYNSTETCTEQDILLHQIEEKANITDEAVFLCASDAAQPHSPPSTTSNRPEPVCYSVEAVLGPQLFRPFPSFYNTPESKESTSLSAPENISEATLGSTTQNEVPYSVDTVLRSFKSVENSTFGQRSTPPSVKTEEIAGPLLRSQHQIEKVSLSTGHELNKSQEKKYKSLSSLQVHTSLISSPDLCPSSGGQKRCGDMPESLKTAQRASHEVNQELLHPPVIENSASSKSKGEMKESTQLPIDNTCPPKHPTQLKPHLSGISPSLGVSEFKGRTAAPVEPAASFIEESDSADFAVHHFVTKQLAEIHQYPRKPSLKPGAPKPCSNKMSPQCSGETATRGDFSIGCKKTQKIPFTCLFANPISECVMTTPDSVRTPQSTDVTSEERLMKTAVEPDKTFATSFLSLFATSLSESMTTTPDSVRTPQSTDVTSEERLMKTTVEPDNTSATSFLSLFATPLSETSSTPPCSQESADNTFHSSKDRVSDLEPPSCQSRTDVKRASHSPTSVKCSPGSKTETDPVKQPVNPGCSLVPDTLKEMPSSPAIFSLNPSETLAPPDVSSPRRAATNSVLKSLFLSLSPFQEDGEQQDRIQISVPPESEINNKGSVGCVFGKQQRKRKKHQGAAHSTEDQPCCQTPQR